MILRGWDVGENRKINEVWNLTMEHRINIMREIWARLGSNADGTYQQIFSFFSLSTSFMVWNVSDDGCKQVINFTRKRLQGEIGDDA